jgi:hypothetical protein
MNPIEDPANSLTEDLSYFDPATPLTPEILARFEMVPGSFQSHTFKDKETGQDNTYYTGKLTFDGLAPYFTAEGPSYGLQASNSKKDDKNDIESKKDFTVLPDKVNAVDLGQAGAEYGTSVSAVKKEKGEYIRKTKYQVPIQLTKEADPEKWTPAEKILINFINDGLRKIYAAVIARNPTILNLVGSKIVDTVQEQFAEKLQEPGAAELYPDQNAQGVLFSQLVNKCVYTAVVKKVYRKKKKVAEGQALNPMESPFDPTSHPAVYASSKNYVNQETGQEVFMTKFYQQIPDTEEIELTGEQAKAYGRCVANAGINFGEGYFGAQISPQLVLGEVILKEKIVGSGGYTGRMIRPTTTARDPKLVKAVSVQPKNSAGPATLQMPMPNAAPITPIAQVAAPIMPTPVQVAGPQSFDPASFNMAPSQNLPGVEIAQ